MKQRRTDKDIVQPRAMETREKLLKSALELYTEKGYHSLDDAGKPIRWKVENSWGEDVGEKGFYVMDDKWFGEYAFQILLEKKYLSDEQKAAFDTEPIVLKPWDPMGSLAI